MIGRWVRRVMGTDEMLAEIREERETTKELMGQMSRTAEAQAQAVNGMIAVLDRIYRAYETDGTPPTDRHLSEAMEDQILEEAWYGSNESNGE